MKNKYIIKNRIISFCLTAALILTTMYFTEVKGGVHATAIREGNVIKCTMSTGGGSSYDLKIDENGNQLLSWAGSYSDQDGGSMEVNTTDIFDLDSGTSLNIVSGDITINSVIMHGASTYGVGVNVSSDASLTVTGDISADQTDMSENDINNYGTLYIDHFDTSTLEGITVTNNGTISAGTIDISSGTISSSSEARYVVSDSFKKGDSDLPGTVVANSQLTRISSDGGTFTLEYNGWTKEITEAVSGITAGELIMTETEVSIGDIPTIYQGTEYDLSEYVTVSPSNYNGTVEIKYAENGSTAFSDEKPTTYGYYNVQATAPDTDWFYGDSVVKSFNIDLLPMPENPLTMTGVKNQYYVKDSVKLTPPSGYLVKSSEADSDFVDSIEFDEEFMNYQKSSYGGINQDMFFSLKRSSDGAETDTATFYDLFPILDELIFDKDKPAISGKPIVDGVEQTIANGDEVEAEKVEITISDLYLEKVVADGKTYTADDSIVSEEMGTAEKSVVVTLEAVEGSPRTCSIAAYDLAGNEYQLSFGLTHPNDNIEPEPEPDPEVPTEEPIDDNTETPTEEPTTEDVPKIDPELTVSLDDQYYGVNYYPSIETDSDGADNVYYMYKVKGTADDKYSFTKPVEVGAYTVRATVPDTERYNIITATTDYTISYLEEPENPYTVSGVKGLKDYYITEIQLYAKPGYSIAKWMNGNYTDKVTYTEGMSSVCLMRDSDGAKTSPVEIKEKFKIDTVSPMLSSFGRDQDGKSVDLSKKVYADTVTFTIYDEHLEEVRCDNDKLTIKDNEAKVSIDSDGGKKDSVIVAVDEAGNKYTLNVELLAAWMLDNIIPSNKKVVLETGSLYNLGSGKWTVSGDSTVYNGGNGIYVNSAGDYTFTKID